MCVVDDAQVGAGDQVGHALPGLDLGALGRGQGCPIPGFQAQIVCGP